MDIPIFMKLSRTTDNTKDEFYVNIHKIVRFGTTNASGVRNRNYIIIENDGTQFIDQTPEEIGATLNKVLNMGVV